MTALRAIVLAAGKGTRMKSARPKVLHAMCGRPMLWYVLRALSEAGAIETLVVTNGEIDGHVAEIAVAAGLPGVKTVVQEPQLGTGHAAQVALAKLQGGDGTLLVVNGDMPLVDAEIIVTANRARDGAALAMVTARIPLPSSFGRVVRDGDRVARIVEARDANDDELGIDEMNAGLYAYDEKKLRAAVAELGRNNAQGEYYLTDTIGHLVGAGERVMPVIAGDYRTVLGVNDRIELADAARLLNQRLCERHMRAGVTIVDPATTYLEPDLEIAADARILPNSAVGGKTRIGADSEIGPNARLRNARIGRHVSIVESIVVDSTVGDFAVVGPWAHVRAGSEIGTGARIGNYVEIKASEIAPGVRAGHLTYLGDASVGERANIGAGTITCNFDGAKKNRTKIGKDAFIGSNSSLVAPVEIGDGALTGAGSVVIRDVEPGDRVAGNPAKPLPTKAAP